MPDIRADGIAVYVFRRVGGALQLLQIHRSATTGEYQRSWQTVYGGVEKGETAVQAALRELREETGLVPRQMFQVEYLESFYFMPHDYVLVMPVFGVEVAETDVITLNHEHDDFRWIAEADVDAAFMWRTQREAVRYLLEALHHPTAARSWLAVDLAPRLHR